MTGPDARQALRHGGDRVAEVLQAHGVSTLFTLCGGHISPILSAAKARGIRVVDVRDAVAASSLSTVVGPVKWGGPGPMKNVSKTPLVLGQWVKGTKNKVELVVVNNEAAKNIPAGGTMQLI